MPEVTLDPQYDGCYDGCYNGGTPVYDPLISLLIMELRDALIHGREEDFDGNCNLNIMSRNTVFFNIFVDCGEFDYIDHCILPDGSTLEFGHELLRQVEWNVRHDSPEMKEFNRIVSGDHVQSVEQAGP